ncbi:recombinase RecA [Desulfofundulus salinus]|uniref:Protein RecA n=1 Tax=Desulfofundulus salinus TaxID=2419843 RepID=A0A494WZH5_9FIRM|nr:recombinase RecA [Desulfofundulus salinum]RKO66347.1 recombinase RecA [Desulfofundulus salinum]
MARAEKDKPATREEVLENALKGIRQKYGDGSIMRLGENPRMNVEAIPTGILSLDIATGIGGLPRGRIVELFGPESSGKTTVALHAIAEAQKAGGTAVFIDAEHSLDPLYARKLGVDIENLLVSQPDYGEQALNICEDLIESGAIDVIAIDSVAALVPKAEIEGEMGELQVGLQARLMSQALRKLAAIVNKTRTLVIFINQLREKVGGGHGNFNSIQETTPGGRALKFYASMRLEVRKKENIKDKEGIIGSRTLIRVVKNKLAPPFKETTVSMIHGEGISREWDVLEMAEKLHIIQKSGTWYSFNGEQLGQGMENARKFLKSYPEVTAQIVEKIKAAIVGGNEMKPLENKVIPLVKDPE